MTLTPSAYGVHVVSTPVNGFDGRDKRQDDDAFNTYIVKLILDGGIEEALDLLCKYYKVDPVRILVGTVKRHRGAAACYLGKNKTIYVSRREYLSNPYVILHEFYHHLRSLGGKHKGTERHADEFAMSYMNSFHRSPTSIKA